MAVTRVGYFGSGSAGTGVKDITKVMTTDNYIFVLSGLSATIRQISNIVEDTGNLKAIPKSVILKDNFVTAGPKDRHVNNGVSNGSSVPSSLTVKNQKGSYSTKSTDLLDNSKVFDHLKVKCQNAVLPGMSSAAFDINLQGFNQKFRGKREYSRSFSITYAEDVQFGTSNIFRAWSELMVGTFTGTGYSDKYKVNAILYIFTPDLADRKQTANSNGNSPSRENAAKIDKGPIAAFSFLNVFPTSVEQISLSGESTGPAKLNVTFAYDIFVPGNTLGEFDLTYDFNYENRKTGLLGDKYKSSSKSPTNKTLDLIDT